MLSFNNKHFNITNIVDKSGLLAAELKNDYRFFGLSQEGQSNLITIEYNEDCINSRLGNDENYLNLKNFMSLNYIKNNIDGSNWDMDVITIGFRRDLRENIVLSSCLLNTIIYSFENKLKLNTNNIIPNFPQILIDN